jgi:hypothetical protein
MHPSRRPHPYNKRDNNWRCESNLNLRQRLHGAKDEAE